MQHHKYSLGEIDGLIPWERDVYVDMLVEHIKEEEMKMKESKEKILTSKIKNLDHKISLIRKNDLDYLDILYREKFSYGTKDEIIIKLK